MNRMNADIRQSFLALTILVIGATWLVACGSPVSSLDNGSLPASATATAPAASLPSTTSFSEPAPNIRFGRIGLSSGLSQSVVNCILQDTQGFIWIGTQDGLNRYDGYTFKIFRPDSSDNLSISDRWITTLFQDKQGYIWIGTRLGGLNRYDPVTGLFKNFANDPANPSSLINDQVHVVFEDTKDRLWIGTAGGLDRFLPDSDGFEHFDFNVLPVTEPNTGKPLSVPERPVDNITAIFEDKMGNLWIGTAYAGLNRYDDENNVFMNYSQDNNDPFSLSSNNIRSIQEDYDGTLWVATDKGINHFYPKTGFTSRFLHAPGNPGSLASNSVRVVHLDSMGNLWIGTSSGLDWFDRSTGSFVHYQNDPGIDSSLSNNSITAINESSDKVLWVGTSGGGLNKYFRGQARFMYYHYDAGEPNNLSGNNVRAVSIDRNGDVWIGTLDGGLDHLIPNEGRISKIVVDPNNPGNQGDSEIWSVLTDFYGVLWVGTSSGVDMVPSNSTEIFHFQHNPFDPASLTGSPVYAMLEDHALNLWFGTEFGLDRYDRSKNVFVHYKNDPGDPNSISGNEIETLFPDRDGSLWIGTFNDGLNHFDPLTGQFIRYQHSPNDPGSISSDSILSIYQDKLGILWIGTDGGGLNRLTVGTNSFTHYGEEDGLPNSVIYGILEDEEGYLWLSTNYGISRFDPVAGKSIRNYTIDDGLQGNEFSPNSSAKDKDGRLYFGGVNGLTAFDPGMVNDSSFVPPVVLLSITQNGMPLNGETVPEYVREITLRWPQNSFEFKYSALSYAQPGKTQYAYMLENFDKSWNQVGDGRDGRYTNLAGGNYVLRIKASNQDGIWSGNGIAVRVNVVPPIWQTLWFQIILGVSIIAIGLTIYVGRVRSIQSYNRALEFQVRDRTKEIEKLFERTKELAIVEERNRLARELHDSAKQKAFAALAQLGTANGILKKNLKGARSHLIEAENLVYEVIEELTFLIQEMYPVALKEKGLATTLREYVFEWEDRTNIQADVEIEEERDLHLNIEQAIYRVVQEALSNVSRHSRATHVKVELSYKQDAVVVIIADNGCGFDQEIIPSGVGLRSIRERIESLGGLVEINSLPDCGTTLTVQLPI